VLRLVEDNNGWAERRDGEVKVESLRGIVELDLKVLHVRARGVPEKLKEVAVQTVRSRSVNNNVRYREDLQQKTRPLILIGRDAEQALGVQ